MKYLRQTGTADEFITKFKTLAANSKITEDNSLIKYFMEGIAPKLVEKIYGLGEVPTTILEWYTYASRFDNQWRRARSIVNRHQNDNTRKLVFNRSRKYEAPRLTYSSRDPSAMDVSLDCLTQEERTDHIKKGLCFECHQFRHRASDHKAGTSKQTKQKPNTFQNKKFSGKDTYAKIRTLMADLEGDDKEDVLKKMEDEGF